MDGRKKSKIAGKNDNLGSPPVPANIVGIVPTTEMNYQEKFNSLKMEFRKLRAEARSLRDQLEKQRTREAQYLFLLSNSPDKEGIQMVELTEQNNRLQEESQILKTETRKLRATLSDLGTRNYKLGENISDAKETLQRLKKTHPMTADFQVCQDQFLAAIESCDTLKHEVVEMQKIKTSLVELIGELREIVAL